MHLRFLGGGQQHIRLDELGSILRHPYLMAFYLAITLVNLAIAAPLNAVSARGTALNLLMPLVCLGMIAGILVLVGSLNLLARLHRGHGPVRIHLSAPLFVSIFAGQATIALSQQAFLGLPFPPLWLVVLAVLLYQAIGEAFLAVLDRKMAARILADVRALHASGTPPEPEPTALVAGTTHVPHAALLRLGAQGNYVKVTTDSGETLVTGPLSTLVAQLPEDLGALVHRSDWVATRAVASVSREGRSTSLTLTDGETVRVASSREAAIRDWLSLFPSERTRRKSTR